MAESQLDDRSELNVQILLLSQLDHMLVSALAQQQPILSICLE